MKKSPVVMDSESLAAEKDFLSVRGKSLFLRNYLTLFSALSLAFLGLVLPTDLLGATINSGFPYTTMQLGQNGHMGTGGQVGIGGKGGKGGDYSGEGYDIFRPHTDGWAGAEGGKGGSGGTGGAGGAGTFILENTAKTEVFTNQGGLFLGGINGITGPTGLSGMCSGGKGGNAAKFLFGAQRGAEPDPDPWLDTYQGGAPEPFIGAPGAGNQGGGGGGTWSGSRKGGAGGDGINGLLVGVGGTGLEGASEGFALASSFTNAAALQIGANGGQGGQGGQGGCGGGGGGGAFPDILGLLAGAGVGGAGGAPGKGGDGGAGGAGGAGKMEVRNNWSFINEGTLHIGRGSSGGEGYLKVRPGGELTNSSNITIHGNGKLENLGGKVSNNVGGEIYNEGTIDNNGVFVNDGLVTSLSAEFFNYGVFKGTGTYVGHFTNTGGGTVAPGNSIGTMNVDGDFLFNEGVLEIEIADFNSFDILEITGTASFDAGWVLFKPWEDYDFSDILPRQSKLLEFVYTAGGISDFFSMIAFADGFLPSGYGYNVYNDGYNMFLEVSNNVPIPSAIWLFGFGLVGLAGFSRKFRNR